MKNFYKLWLVLGLIQIALFQGCSANNQTDGLLSSTAQASESFLNEDNRDESSNRQSNGVRISRAFFEKSLAGKVRVQAAQNQNAEEDSDVIWEVRQPTAPAPTLPVIGDFREQAGCASYANLNGINLCFNIVPDVSSIGVNGEEVKVEGVEDFLNSVAEQNNSNCHYSNKSIQFNRASKEDQTLRVTFVAEGDVQEGCIDGPVQIEFSLKQI